MVGTGVHSRRLGYPTHAPAASDSPPLPFPRTIREWQVRLTPTFLVPGQLTYPSSVHHFRAEQVAPSDDRRCPALLSLPQFL